MGQFEFCCVCLICAHRLVPFVFFVRTQSRARYYHLNLYRFFFSFFFLSIKSYIKYKIKLKTAFNGVCSIGLSNIHLQCTRFAVIYQQQQQKRQNQLYIENIYSPFHPVLYRWPTQSSFIFDHFMMYKILSRSPSEKKIESNAFNGVFNVLYFPFLPSSTMHNTIKTNITYTHALAPYTNGNKPNFNTMPILLECNCL